ncbi:SpaA isopeptide-forming pilin-related protein [Mollicutes bacterium LVI A0039]|nr:SpaA isopeptide-forming pilin-related protein [Mollicutes bacterium LVI A0039]
MFALINIISNLSVLYGSEINIANKSESSEATIEIEEESSEILDLDNMSQEQIARQFDPDPTSQDFIILDSNQLRTSRGYQLTALQSGYNLSTFNASLYGKFALYKVNGKYVYCIEPTSDIISVAQKVSSSKSKYNSFSANTKSYLERTMSSAFGKYNQTKNTDYLFAGQLLVWEHLSTTNSDLANPWRIRSVDQFRSEINEIENEVRDWYKLPSFLSSSITNPKVHTLKYDAKSDSFSIILTDSNGVWDAKYANYNDFGGFTITNPSGANNVKIAIDAQQLATSSSVTYKWIPALADAGEFYDAGQDLVSVGASPVSGYMAFKTEKKPQGGFKITKVNAQTNELLEGAEYSLYDESGKFVQKYTTNKYGNIDSGLSLMPGKYTLVETKAPVGFVLDSTRHSISVTDGKVTDYTGNSFKNSPISGGFELKKVGVNIDGSKVPLANIEFTVTSTTYPEFSRVYKTDSQGQIKTTASELLFGSYTITETKNNNDYVGGYKQDFEISKHGEIVKLNAGMAIENYQYVNRVEIIKLGQSFDNNNQSEYPIPGTKFKVFQEAEVANGVIDSADRLIEEITTDKNGHAQSRYLPTGNYLLQESLAADGYLLSDTVYPFTVNKNSGNQNHATIELEPISNKVITGRAMLTKVGVRPCDDKVCSTPLNNVSFGIYPNGADVDTPPIEVITTNSDGIAMTSELKYGKYYAQEIANKHENYRINNQVYEFTISEMDSIVEINDGQPIGNQEKLGYLKIYKRGKSLEHNSDEIKLLEGAEYTIFDHDNNPVEVLTTNERGESQSLGLSFGEYSIIETKAPKGYELDDSVYNFEINEKTYEQPIELKFSDQVITNQIKVSKIDKESKSELPGASLEIRDRQSDELVKSWVSTSKPYVTELKTGKYEVCETAAPNGYTRKITCENFKVEAPQITQKFIVENKPVSITTTGNQILRFVLKLTLIVALLLVVKFGYNLKQRM